MRAVRLTLFLAVGIVAFGAAAAGEVLYFTNGTTMVIESHTVENGMIHVDLGSKAKMAFPEDMVEKIESSGRSVYLRSSRPANVTLSSGPAANGAAAGGVGSGRRGGQGEKQDHMANVPSRPDANGIETMYPYAAHSNRAVRNVGVQGSTALLNNRGRGGAKFGGRQVIMPQSSSNRARPELTRIQPRVGAFKPKAPPPPPSAGAGEGDAGDGGAAATGGDTGAASAGGDQNPGS